MKGIHFSKGGGHKRRVVQLEGDGPGEVEGGRQLSEDHVAQDFGAVIVIFTGVFDEAEPVDITHVRFAIRSAREVVLVLFCFVFSVFFFTSKEAVPGQKQRKQY